jgi:hypothetical protein
MATGGPIMCPHCGLNILVPNNRPSVEEVKAAMERFIKAQEEVKEPEIEHRN